MKKTVDIIVPCFDEEESIGLFYRAACEVIDTLPAYDCRFIFVDDGSSDGTLAAINGLMEERGDLEYISLSRNFGKEAAMLAGLQHATGDFAVVMDVDLQHPPALLRDMLTAVDGGKYDTACARRVSRRGEPRIRNFFARTFYGFFRRLSRLELVDGALDYRVMNRQVVDAVLSLSESQRFSRGIFAWIGFRTKWVELETARRVAGESKWTVWRLLLYALGGVVAFSTAPLRAATVAGLAVMLASVAALVWGLLDAAFHSWTTAFPFLTVLLLLVGGGILLVCGVLGEYIAQILLETKRRPVYIERESSFGRDG